MSIQQKKTGVYDSPKIREMYGCVSPKCSDYDHHPMCLFMKFVLPVIDADRRRDSAVNNAHQYQQREKLVQKTKRKQLKEEKDKKRKGFEWMKV